MQIAVRQAVHVCRRCGTQVTADEFARSRQAFERVFCDKCFDEVYIERRNMDTLDYKIGMMKKQKLYQQEGKRLVSLYAADKPRLREVLRGKLAQQVRHG